MTDACGALTAPHEAVGFKRRRSDAHVTARVMMVIGCIRFLFMLSVI